jgi:hypothetical protein
MRGRRPNRQTGAREELPPLSFEVRPSKREEAMPYAVAAIAFAFAALIVCMGRNYMLLYGDAVAHLGIARRILDTRNPGLVQLGGVWLPLPHLLMLPFVQKMQWWQNGLAGAWPSLLAYVLSVAGLYRLARRVVPTQWAMVATLFYALNPNLLYLSTTAMTEPLFLAIIIWMTLLAMECVAAIGEARLPAVKGRLIGLGILILAAVFTRYDGWIFGAAVWCVVAWKLFRTPKVHSQINLSFGIFTLLAVAGPIAWLVYNQHFFHDPLDFMRGPYSALAIERKTSKAGVHHPGWHNPFWAAIVYLRTAQLDTSAWETGFAVVALAFGGLVIAIRKRLETVSTLLWVPLPFYIYSIAYGSIPIFIPKLFPHSFYNSRYGVEMLPAFAIFACIALSWMQERGAASQPLLVRLMTPVALLLVVLNAIGMMYYVPLVLKEAMVNSTTRIPFEQAIADEIKTFPAGAPILMYNSDHVGALQRAGIPLKQTISETDYDSWKAALADPAKHAAYVVAIAGDPVSEAVAAHPEDLIEMSVLCTTHQPCARIYRSSRFQ